MNQETATGSKSSGLEIIRAISALTVIASHLFYYELLPKTKVAAMATAFATEAVMVFFVLSGTVISLSSQKKRDPIAFMERRLLRILPIYLATITLTAIITYIVSAQSLPPSQVLGNLFFLQSLGGWIVSAPALNAPLWSISYEMTYYALFAMALCAGWTMLVWIVAAVLCAITASYSIPPGPIGHFVAVLSLSIPWIFGHISVRLSDRMPAISVSEGCCFLIIGLLYARSPLSSEFYDPFRLTAFALSVCPLIIAIVQGGNEPLLQRRTPRLLFFAVGVALLWSFSISETSTKMALTTAGLIAALTPLSIVRSTIAAASPLRRPLIYIGSISYALYVTHAPILHFVNYVLPQSAILRLGVFILVAWGLAHFLERRAQPFVKSWIVRRGPFRMNGVGE